MRNRLWIRVEKQQKGAELSKRPLGHLSGKDRTYSEIAKGEKSLITYGADGLTEYTANTPQSGCQRTGSRARRVFNIFTDFRFHITHVRSLDSRWIFIPGCIPFIAS